MTIIRKWLIPAAASILFITLNSCNTGEEPDKKEEMRDTVMVSDTNQAVEGDVSYTLPSTLQIANIFKKSGLRYYSGITNSVDNVNSYKATSPGRQALLLGVYSADLSYCMLNKQSEECKKYFKACKELAGGLGLAQPFESVAKRMEKNLDNQDSLAMILVGIQMETDNIMQENNQEYLSVISFTGAWIESMYIGVEVHSKEGNIQMTQKLVEQMGIAESILKALRAHIKEDKAIERLVKYMSELNEIYNGFEVVKQIKATDPDVIDPAKIQIGVKDLMSFANKLESIREEIVKK